MGQSTRKHHPGPWAMALALVLAAALLAASLAAGTEPTPVEKGKMNIGTGYADTLFDTSRLHTVNILISDLNWAYMIQHATEEQYVLCDVVIDGEKVESVALRPKGNSSLTAIQAQGSEHFSFKIEFDHYRAGNTWHGLDKLCLNNLGNDPTCMKDYFAYRLMQECGAPGSLAAYTLVQVNGADFGLYLAVEAVEESFSLRNYGEIAGQIYKPELYAVSKVFSLTGDGAFSLTDASPASLLEMAETVPGQRVELLAESLLAMISSDPTALAVASVQYVGDDPDLYGLIFDSAVFKLTREQRLAYVQAVKTLCGSENPLDALDLSRVVAYFAAQNFVDNYDGYTGGAVHNYYLRERDGRLSMIPWDYNLAFGAFTMDGAVESFLGDSDYAFQFDLGAALTAEESAVNYPIDTPIQAAENSDRPMFGAWIDDPAAHAAYYAVYQQLLANYFDSGRFQAEYQAVYELIHPLVAQGLTFWTLPQFERGAANLRRFCELRSESIRRQVEGTIPATKAGQMAHPETLIATGDLNLSQTLSFDGLVMGIRAEDIIEILDAVSGEDAHSMETIVARLSDLMADASGLPTLLGAVFRGSSLLQRTVRDILQPISITLLCLIALVVAVKQAKRPRRRRGS